MKIDTLLHALQAWSTENGIASTTYFNASVRRGAELKRERAAQAIQGFGHPVPTSEQECDEYLIAAIGAEYANKAIACLRNELGFTAHGTGGGYVALRRDFGPYHVLVTDDEGLIPQSTGPVLVGLYDEEGEVGCNEFVDASAACAFIDELILFIEREGGRIEQFSWGDPQS